MIFILIVLLIFSVDLAIKKLVEAKVGDSESIPLAGGNIKISKLHNHGFAYGFLKDKPEFIKGSTFIVLVVSMVYFIGNLFKKGNRLLKLGLSMILGGGLCNFFDRMHQGYVTDYISVTKGPKRLKNTVFNLSDLFIALGSVIALIGGAIRLFRKK